MPANVVNFFCNWSHCSKCYCKNWIETNVILLRICGFTVEAYCCSVVGCQQRFLGDCAGNSYQSNQSCIKDDEEVSTRVTGACDVLVTWLFTAVITLVIAVTAVISTMHCHSRLCSVVNPCCRLVIFWLSYIPAYKVMCNLSRPPVFEAEKCPKFKPAYKLICLTPSSDWHAVSMPSAVQQYRHDK